MGLVYHTATLTPGKQELVADWLPSRPWAAGLEITGKVGEYRFDDPAGAVGVETILWATGEGTILQVPLTYRSAPLDGADDFLVGTTDHSVLGTRWVYDACLDPIWATALATTILTGGTQAQMYVEKDGQRVDVPARVPVQGSGQPGAPSPTLAEVDSAVDAGSGGEAVTVVRAGDLELVVARVVGARIESEETLLGQVADRSVVLAGLRRHG
jgi:hypothetical protein